MSEERERRGIIFWIAVVLFALPLLYVLSSAPLVALGVNRGTYYSVYAGPDGGSGWHPGQ